MTQNDMNPDLQQIFNKIANEQELTPKELEDLLFDVDCTDSSLQKILCMVHATLDVGKQGDIEALANTMQLWAEQQGITSDY